MTRRAKTDWQPGAIFAIPLADGSRAIGQAIGLMLPNVVYCALTDLRVRPEAIPTISAANVVACVALTRDQLDHGAWPALRTAAPVVSRGMFRNEAFAASGYVGVKIYDAAL